MRVIAGKFKGRRLLCPSGTAVRPTADAAKETLFNLLGGRVEGSSALDLFAGVGALGIEALSRGARRVDFVERDGRTLKYLAKNLERAGIGEEARVLRGDAFGWVKKLHAMAQTYDLAFVDPPYEQDMVGRFLSSEQGRPLLGKGATLVLQHHVKEEVQPLGARYVLETERLLGDTVITVLVVR